MCDSVHYAPLIELSFFTPSDDVCCLVDKAGLGWERVPKKDKHATTLLTQAHRENTSADDHIG